MVETPEQLEQERLQKSFDDNLILSQIEQDNIDYLQIENATPVDLKAMGLAKLPLILLVIGNQVKQIINTSLNKLQLQYVNANTCPSPQTLEEIKLQRNNIVIQLNKISKNLNRITLTLTGVSTFLNLLQNTIRGINVAKIAAKIAAAAFPPLAPALPTTLNTLSTAKNEILVDDEGNSRLQKISSIVGGASLVTSIVGQYILTAIFLLESIDLFLKRCEPNITLEEISSEAINIADLQKQSQSTQNETTYDGFIIEIEIVPFTSTVNRRRAIGKNQQGITLISTPLSFTTDDQTLINELKFIIEKNNLKAY
jgi:hypothetical protein